MLETPVFIGVSRNRFEDSHSLRQFSDRDFPNIFAQTDESAILSA